MENIAFLHKSARQRIGPIFAKFCTKTQNPKVKRVNDSISNFENPRW